MAKPNPRILKDPQLRPVARAARGAMRDVLRRKVVDLRLLRTLRRATGPLDERAEPQPPTSPFSLPADDVPLSVDEVESAFRDRAVTRLPWIQQAAAVLDAREAPMKAEEIEAFLAGLTRYREKLGPRNGPSKSDLFLPGEGGRLTLNPAAPGLAAMRRAIRELSQPALVQRAAREAQRADAQRTPPEAQRTAPEPRTVVRRAKLDVEAQRDAEIARTSRRAVLRVVPSAAHPQAAALLDVGQRSIQTFVGRDVAELGELLARFDVIAGLDIRDALRALGLDADRRRVVDLGPPQTSRRLSPTGRTLQITPELLIAGTTRIGRPLGEPERVARYLSGGEHQRLARRIESDVKALHAFYQYGILHGSVRLRLGVIDEAFAIDWALPGDVSLHQQLKSARETCAAIDLVIGAAPGWADPWSRARRVRVVDLSLPEVVLTRDEEGNVLPIGRDEIQAIRLAPDDAAQWAWNELRIWDEQP
ncbi:hypothetical protein WMF04_18200 [Sorangium sp. So ce260]|uniref:hypothetical protein n=1 Tax=Sorangium sp. So ce260 TaxID=3133291 RepID=UPI003F622D13